MPLAADDKLGIGDERAGRRRKPFGAVLADPNDGEPSRLLTVRAHNATSQQDETVKLLILGGSGEAADLARALAGDVRYDVTLSLAGRTAEPASPSWQAAHGRVRRR